MITAITTIEISSCCLAGVPLSVNPVPPGSGQWLARDRRLDLIGAFPVGAVTVIAALQAKTGRFGALS